MPRLVLVALVAIGAIAGVRIDALQSASESQANARGATPFDAAQTQFFNGQYDSAAEAALAIVEADPTNIEGYELRSTALLFEIRRAVGNAPDKDRAFKQCTYCPKVMADFQQDTTKGQEQARTRLKSDPKDVSALFLLGKLDLNHVWLHLGTLGHRTGWNEYWEARHSLDTVLERNPTHVRARVARAWIDYIVDTKMSWGTRWVLGGGNKKRALVVMRDAAQGGGGFFTNAEARFALWDVHVRERNYPEALAMARGLAVDFPANVDLERFIEKYSQTR